MKSGKVFISGFSLVEVTLALSVVVFGLLTILGLLAAGINSSQVSMQKTSATNVLTAIVADVQSTPNPLPKGSAQTSPIYGIALPAAGAATSATPTTIYFKADGTTTTTVTGAVYQLNVWTTGPTTTQQETLVRLLITWPAPAAYTAPQGILESVIALNRT